MKPLRSWCASVESEPLFFLHCRVLVFSLESFSKCCHLLLQETARKNYVDMVSSLSSSSESSSQIKPGADGEQRGYETLVVTSQDGITKIMLNRPTKKNAISTQVTSPALGVCPLFFSSSLYCTQILWCCSIIPIFVLSVVWSVWED